MDFSAFLTTKLKEKKIDVGVYHGYLLSILEDSIDDDEKREMITEIINGLIEADVDSLVAEIFNKWTENHAAPEKPVEQPTKKIDIAEMLKTQTELAQQASTHHNRHLTDEERRIKEQILASYSQTSDKEDEDDEDESDGSSEDPNLEKNTNKSDVQKLAKEKREQAKLESQQKKLKDKEDRAKQKASREDKKAKRQQATVKGERRR